MFDISRKNGALEQKKLLFMYICMCEEVVQTKEVLKKRERIEGKQLSGHKENYAFERTKKKRREDDQKREEKIQIEITNNRPKVYY